MREVTYYFADDNTQFMRREDCEEWERTHQSLPATYHLYDGCGKEIITSNYFDTIEAFDLAHMFKVDNVDGWIEDGETVKNYWGLTDFIAAPGYYVYIDMEDMYNFYEQCPNDECPVSMGWNSLGKVLEMHDILGISEDLIEEERKNYE